MLVMPSRMKNDHELTTNASIASASSHDGSLAHQACRVDLARSRKFHRNWYGVLLLALCYNRLLSGSARPRCKSLGDAVDDLAILLDDTLDKPVLLALAACTTVDTGLAKIIITVVADTAVEVVGV